MRHIDNGFDFRSWSQPNLIHCAVEQRSNFLERDAIFSVREQHHKHVSVDGQKNLLQDELRIDLQPPSALGDRRTDCVLGFRDRNLKMLLTRNV